jgi:lysozyme family protein
MKEADIIAAAKDFGPRFCAWLGFILEWEGAHDKEGNIVVENVRGDNGGRTFAGIDQASHPAFNYAHPKAADVGTIYFWTYWQGVRASDLEFPVGEVTANFGVNMGLRQAVKMLQTAINVIPAGGACVVDGWIGDKTVAASKLEDSDRMAELIEQEADERYRGIARANPTQRKFLQGWLNRDTALDHWWRRLAPPHLAAA